MQPSKCELTKVFENFLEEYVLSNFRPEADSDNEIRKILLTSKEIDRNQERLLASNFLATPCYCGKECQEQFSESELIEAREAFRVLTWSEKNCAILAQLRSFQRISDHAKSARRSKARKSRQVSFRSYNLQWFEIQLTSSLYSHEHLR